MKVRMVLVVMALALGGLACSEEPPEQWSHPMRQAIVDGCESAGDNADPAFVKRLEDGGYTNRGICREILNKLEALYTESDWLLLSQEEQDRIGSKVSRDYGRELGREIGSD